MEKDKILERKIKCFLATLKDADNFILRKIVMSKEFKQFLKDKDKGTTPSLFAYDGEGIGEGLFAS